MPHALIIEDEPLIAFHIADVAEEAGARSVAFAQSEIEAINAALQQKPDIILSDVKLLSGTGPAAVTRIRHEYGRIPVIFITGNPESLSDYDHDGVMEKPLEEERLRHEVAQHAVRHQASNQR